LNRDSLVDRVNTSINPLFITKQFSGAAAAGGAARQSPLKTRSTGHGHRPRRPADQPSNKKASKVQSIDSIQSSSQAALPQLIVSQWREVTCPLFSTVDDHVHVHVPRRGGSSADHPLNPAQHPQHSTPSASTPITHTNIPPQPQIYLSPTTLCHRQVSVIGLGDSTAEHSGTL